VARLQEGQAGGPTPVDGDMVRILGERTPTRRGVAGRGPPSIHPSSFSLRVRHAPKNTQVVFHVAVRKPGAPPSEPPIFSTRPEHAADAGTLPTPAAAVLGRGARLPRGWELALAGLSAGGRALVRCGGAYGFIDAAAASAADPDPDAPPVQAWGPPPRCEAGGDYEADLTLLAIHPASSIGVGGTGGDVVRRTLVEGDTWETPRPPFEVGVRLVARVPDVDGVSPGEPYFSTPEGELLSATMGDGSLPPGLEDAIATVTRGETAVVSVPAGRCVARPEGKAQGGAARAATTAVPSPPPGATRVEWEVTLARMVQVRDLVGDGSVTKKRVVDGRGEFPADCPLDDNVVRIHVRAVVVVEGADGGDGEEGPVVWDTRASSPSSDPLRFTLGTGAVPDAVDLAVRLMTPGETAVVLSDDSHAWGGGRADRPAGCPPGARVEFTIELVDFDRTPVGGGGEDVDPADLLSRAADLRAQGNALFAAATAGKKGDPTPSSSSSTTTTAAPADVTLRRAMEKWRRSAHVLSNALDFAGADEAVTSAAASGRAAAHANLALACLRAGRAGEAIAWADRALGDDPGHAKALLRKGAACAALGRFGDADACFDAAAAADPAAAAEAAREKARVAARRAAEDARQKREMRAFFDR
jgi:hypothetical protein